MDILFLLAGIYCIVAAFFNWDWFFNNRRARPFVRCFGRNGARIIYVLLGLFLIFISQFLDTNFWLNYG